jgi:hypothetical protein
MAAESKCGRLHPRQVVEFPMRPSRRIAAPMSHPDRGRCRANAAGMPSAGAGGFRGSGTRPSEVLIVLHPEETPEVKWAMVPWVRLPVDWYTSRSATRPRCRGVLIAQAKTRLLCLHQKAPRCPDGTDRRIP